jgi:hypothetical protein
VTRKDFEHGKELGAAQGRAAAFRIGAFFGNKTVQLVLCLVLGYLAGSSSVVCP